MDEGLLRVLESGSALALAQHLGYKPRLSNNYWCLEKALLADTLSPLAVACDTGRADCVRWLLHVAKVNIHHPTWETFDPIQLSHGAMEIMKLLLAAGFDPQLSLTVLISGWSPDTVHIARIISLLVDYGARAGPSSLHQSANLDTLMFVDEYQRKVDKAVATCTVLYGIAKHRHRSNALPIGDLIKLIAKRVWEKRDEIHV